MTSTCPNLLVDMVSFALAVTLYLAEMPCLSEDVTVFKVSVMIVGLCHTEALMANKTERECKGHSHMRFQVANTRISKPGLFDYCFSHTVF